jgi:preprotein translocase subunit SecB
MQNAAFSIISYQFDKVSIDLSNHTCSELLLDFETNGHYSKSDSTYILTFVVKVFNKDQIDMPFISVQCKGVFKFENVTSLEEIPAFFYRNAIAILFPYVRAYVSLVSTQANVPGVILPTLNLSNLEDALRKSTTQE